MSYQKSQLQLIRFRELVATGVVRNRTTLGRWMEREQDPFPAPLRLGVGRSATVAWRAAEIEAWLNRRSANGREDSI